MKWVRDEMDKNYAMDEEDDAEHEIGKKIYHLQQQL